MPQVEASDNVKFNDKVVSFSHKNPRKLNRAQNKLIKALFLLSKSKRPSLKITTNFPFMYLWLSKLIIKLAIHKKLKQFLQFLIQLYKFIIHVNSYKY